MWVTKSLIQLSDWTTRAIFSQDHVSQLRENLYQSTARSNPRCEPNENSLSFLPISETTTADKQMKQISFRYSEPISDAWYNIEIATAKSFWGHFPGVDVLLAEGNGTLLQYSCLKIPWVEEPGRLQSMGLSQGNLSAGEVIDNNWDFKRPCIFFGSRASNKKHLFNIQDFYDIA